MAKFNEEQQKIIDLRECNILVSAAAGSGKTTVLVERIIKRILDENDPVNIDEMLVLTYTKAAAGEMRERISRAINSALLDNPRNEHLLRQATLIHNAQITTIDSFCLSILKNNFTDIGLEPGFRPATNSEITFIEEDVLDEILEEVLSSREIENIGEFLRRFESKDSISKIRSSIKRAYADVLKAPFVEDCILERRSDYSYSSVEELVNSSWFICMLDKLKLKLGELVDMSDDFHDYLLENGPEEYMDTYNQDRDIIDSLMDAKGYDDLREKLANLSWPRLATAKGCDEDIKEGAKQRRDVYKKCAKSIQEETATSLTEMLDQIQATDKVVKALYDIVYLYYKRLENEKRKKKIVTFADMEHMALQILLKKNEDGNYVPTQTAYDYRKIYKEIMIDEYQDSNDMQEMLLAAISTEDEGKYNRFIVGDMKQSIYRFRNAKPSIFKEKYDEYQKYEGSKLRRINLSKNYRSRTGVIECVNAVFERIMAKDLGGIAYDDDAKLYCEGSFVETSEDTKSELLLMNMSEDSEYNNKEQEAVLIAHKIKSMVGHYMVMNDTRDAMRPCTYRDIVILIRSGNGYDEILRRIMEKEGVPAYITSKSGYFDSVEIVTILNYLKILDNPFVDIPMYGSLISVFGKMNEEDIALLRIFRKDKTLYESMLDMLEVDDVQGIAEFSALPESDIRALRDKCIGFISSYDEYRKMTTYTPIHKLIRKILSDSEYLEHIMSMPLGEQKSANVKMLLTKAESFENDGFKGLFHFNRYIENLHKYGSDDGDAVTLDEQADVVRIMTMHKSKGLEFPICILAGIEKEFNKSDAHGEMVFHDKWGLGLDYVDSERRIKRKDIRKNFISEQILRDGIAEEIRVLYVAMTRAKEKMIMVACVKNVDKLLEKNTVAEGSRDDTMATSLRLSDRLSASSYLDLILRSRGSADWNGQLKLTVESYENVVGQDVSELLTGAELKNNLMRYIDGVSDDADAIRLRERIQKRYPFEYLSDLYHKTSVSELKLTAIHDSILNGSMEEVPDSFFKTHEPEEYIPSFARRETSEPSGTARGSAYHRVMELIDYKSLGDVVTADVVNCQISKCISEGRITTEEYSLVSINKVIKFLNSDLGRRMVVAAKAKKLYLEQPFVLGIPASRLKESFPEDRTVMIQGIIDVFFEENDQVILMDYKTDYVKESKELVDRYKTQLDYYDEAITRIMNTKVKERLIYSFSLEETISL